jgi:hypothetical protein
MAPAKGLAEQDYLCVYQHLDAEHWLGKYSALGSGRDSAVTGNLLTLRDNNCAVSLCSSASGDHSRTIVHASHGVRNGDVGPGTQKK